MDKKGFTLIEVILALGLFSLILFTLLSFSLNNDESMLLEQNVNKLANDLRFAKEYARTNNIGLDFVIDVRNNVYFVRRGNTEILREQLPKDYSISGYRNQIYVNNLGRIQATNNITIINKEGKYGVIYLSTQTGRVRVEIND